jgi:predicted anti-sigma-YlaC factor YlaD
MKDAANNNDAHERARRLIALANPGALSGADRVASGAGLSDKLLSDERSSIAWLAAHLETCESCREFADNIREAIHGLRAIPIAADRSLVSTTQMLVRRRSLELRRRQERLWLVTVSCTAVAFFALLSAAALWRGFEWLGERAQLAPLIWQVGFLVFGVTPALAAGILLLAKDVQMADSNGF